MITTITTFYAHRASADSVELSPVPDAGEEDARMCVCYEGFYTATKIRLLLREEREIQMYWMPFVGIRLEWFTFKADYSEFTRVVVDYMRLAPVPRKEWEAFFAPPPRWLLPRKGLRRVGFALSSVSPGLWRLWRLWPRKSGLVHIIRHVP